VNGRKRNSKAKRMKTAAINNENDVSSMKMASEASAAGDT
jgi:hypothetical protein